MMNKESWALVETDEGVGIILLIMLDVALKSETNQLLVDMAAHPDEYETVNDTRKWARENKLRLQKSKNIA